MSNETTRVQFSEGSIALPPGFEDRTTNLFVPKEPATQPNLSVARDWLREDETLASYIDRQLDQLKAHLNSHKLRVRQRAQLGADDAALDGECIEATYRNGTRTVYQRQAAFVIAPRRALIFTASAPASFDEAFDSFWHTWLAGYQLPIGTDEAEQPS
ncbi:DUF1795 domain-containing protein [Trinickia dinghuensis]|uniref:DUF1795 domain-containing protein n=1 Tax=Trinickia dinghuensis TaxID=2291023 RepID=A0A3D8JR66_9BURK|nr:DUF1795 domain-containing protein [Trinickia dinghuensis]RDU95215.1 DUF1795 domain-containing protein [Trinickia dinghuensis]